MDTHQLPLKTPHTPLLGIVYNKIHVFLLIFTPTFSQHNYPSHKCKLFPPILDAEQSPKHSSLLIHNYLSLRTPISGHETRPCTNFPPI